MSKMVKPDSDITLSLVVPVYHRNCVFHLIEDLGKQSFKNFRLVIVDHGFNKLNEIPQESWVVYLTASPELWFTGAVNVGLRHLLERKDSKCIGVINDDVRIDDPQWVEKMLAVLSSHPCSIVAASCLDEQGRIVYAGLRFEPFRFRFKRLFAGISKNELPDHLVACDALPTRGLVSSAESFVQVGLLDEGHLPQYGSDYEWSMRAKKHGYQLFINPHCWVHTEIRPRNMDVSGRNRYDKPRWQGFMRDFLNPHKNGSLPLLINFARQSFSFPYSHFYIFYHASRKLIGFIYSNFFIRAS